MISAHKLPLEGLRIIDFSWVIAGPAVSRWLADFGAEVIKVESAERLDYCRQLVPLIKGEAGGIESSLFANINCGKLGITLNMGHPKGRDIAKRLILASDVVIDNFAGDVLKRWGLGFKELSRIKPSLIMLSMPVFGSSGPRAGYGAYGTGLLGMTGLYSITGPPDRPPTGPNIAYPDFSSNPMHATTAVLAALHYRNKTGRGQFIELAQYESTVCFVGMPLMDYLVNSKVAGPSNNREPNAAPHGVYRCCGDDRWSVITVFDDKEWQAFCQAIGKPTWTKEQRFNTILGRKNYEDELDRLVEAWTITKTPQEIMLQLQHYGVPAGIVQNGQDLAEQDPQVKERNYYVTLDHPTVGKVVCEGVTEKLSKTPGRVRRPGPTLGQDNEYVYREILEMSDEEIDQYYVEKVIY